MNIDARLIDIAKRKTIKKLFKGRYIASQEAPFKVLYRNRRMIDAFDAAYIDCSQCIALPGHAFSMWMNTTSGTEAGLDDMLVKRVGACSVLGRK